jgi:UDP-2,3-diacylglucosamine hydrolase
MQNAETLPLGLIAGEGVFPLLVARGAKHAGRRVICAALRGSASAELRNECDIFQPVGVLRIGQWIKVLKQNQCTQAIMVGRVRKAGMYAKWRYLQYIPDARTLKIWFTRLRQDKRDHAVLLAVAEELQAEGITLIDSTTFTQDQLAGDGVMTNVHPTEKQKADIEFGWNLCKTISRLDIGQALAVLDKDVIAVEAIEGTDRMIARAGQYCRTPGWTLIKVTNAQQDMRMDVPSVGVQTIQELRAAGAGCLVLETGRTIMLEKEKVIELAEKYRIAIVGRS